MDEQTYQRHLKIAQELKDILIDNETTIWEAKNIVSILGTLIEDGKVNNFK